MKQEIRVAVNGYGVIGKRVADAVAKQQDMRLVGVVDVVADWRPRVALNRGMALFGAAPEHAAAMRKAGEAIEDLGDRMLQSVSRETCRNEGVVMRPDRADMVAKRVETGALAAQRADTPPAEHIALEKTLCAHRGWPGARGPR